METFISQWCAYIALSSYNMDQNACQAALRATYVQSGGQNIYNLGQNYYSKKGEKFIRDNINDVIIYSVAGGFMLDDIYKKKEVKIQSGCKYICNDLSMTLTPTTQVYNVGWKWNW